MGLRYFKATNGRFTVFRSSPTRAYVSATIHCNADRVTDFSLSYTAGRGALPAEEITRAEYNALNAAKQRRIEARGGMVKYAAPRDSWVSNAELAR